MGIQNSINSAFGSVAGAAAVAKHFKNQKEANIEAAAARVDQAKANQKLGEFELKQNAEDIKKAEGEFNTATEKQNELQTNVDKAQEAYRKTQDLANYYDAEGERANFESKDAKGRAKGELRKQAEESWDLRDKTRAQLRDKGYDISKAREALDNQIEVTKGKEFIFNQAKLQRAKLEYQSKLNAENLAKAQAKYKKVGGK